MKCMHEGSTHPRRRRLATCSNALAVRRGGEYRARRPTSEVASTKVRLRPLLATRVQALVGLPAWLLLLHARP